MKGFQVTFFTQQDRRHHGKPIAEWLLQQCKALNIRGATVFAGTEGLDHQGRLHSSHFFELADQPLEVTMVLSREECERLFEVMTKENVNLFYAKTPVEFGKVGEE